MSVLQVDRVVTPIWYVIGITGNTLSAIVWLQRRMYANNSSAVYLVALSISDLLFLLLHFVQVGSSSAACRRRLGDSASGVGTGGSGGSMNLGPRVPGAPG